VAIATAIWNLILFANPIVLIVAGLIALAAGLYIAWQRFETFRNIVKAVWEWIKDHWKLLITIILGPIGIVVVAIIENWQTIVDKTKWLFNKLKTIFNAIKDWLKPWFDAIGGFAKGAIEVIYNVFRIAFDVIGKVWEPIKDAYNDLSPGADLPSLPSMPPLAGGGNVWGSGIALVGERGPEILSLPVGARVTPMQAGQSDLSGLSGVGDVTIHVPLVVDGRQIAEVNHRASLTRAARR
jgi:Flp pilus assembly pilin Flp